LDLVLQLLPGRQVGQNTTLTLLLWPSAYVMVEQTPIWGLLNLRHPSASDYISIGFMKNYLSGQGTG